MFFLYVSGVETRDRTNFIDVGMEKLQNTVCPRHKPTPLFVSPLYLSWHEVEKINA